MPLCVQGWGSVDTETGQGVCHGQANTASIQAKVPVPNHHQQRLTVLHECDPHKSMYELNSSVMDVKK